MSSKGQLYIQPMDQSTSADHGPFYLTLPLNVEHSSLKVRLCSNKNFVQIEIDGLVIWGWLLLYWCVKWSVFLGK